MSANAVLIDGKFFKFILVGIINTLAGSAIMFSLYNFWNVSYWLSSGVSFLFASILSFFLNKYFTFAVKEWTVFIVIAFILTVSISYIIAYGAAKPVMGCLLADSSKKIRENAALLTGMCLFTGMNYLGQRFIVFKNTNNGEDK
jgi:putative flippase GtrA